MISFDKILSNSVKAENLALQGSLLTESYGVFIIKVKKEKQEFILVGTTGNPAGSEAWSPLDRVAFHLKQNPSATSFLFQRLMIALKIKTAEKMKRWFASAQIAFYFVKTDDYVRINKYSEHDAVHREKIEKEQVVKEALIKELSKQYKKSQLLNLQKKREERVEMAEGKSIDNLVKIIKKL